MGGGGLMGSILTTLESTFGGGLKLFLPTCSTPRHIPPLHKATCWTAVLV